MSFMKLLAATLAVYALLNFVVVPRLTKAWKANRSIAKVSKAGLVGAAEFARDTAFVASLMYLAFALATVVLGLSFGRNAGWLEAVVHLASRLHDLLGSIRKVWEAWFFVLALGLLVYLSW